MVGEVDQAALRALIEEAKASGGSELANYQTFVSDLARSLGLDRPAMAKEENRLNDYVFERAVTFHHPNGTSSSGRIDCYKRNCFILEAKQSAKRTKARATEQLELAGLEVTQKPGHARRGSRGWDKVMIAAKKQAEDYARALPTDHSYPPFLLIVDVGNVIEVYADFSGQGRNYAHFPDRQNYRLSMDDLLLPPVQQRLRAIWSDPQGINPERISARVTKDIAKRLAKIAARLERKQAHDPKDIAEFLMRCLFTMFAEDVGLIPDKGFAKLLGQMVKTPEHFAPALESLWKVMDEGGYAPHLNATLKRFNGALFKSCSALPLDEDDIRELWLAAGKDWQDVEPAIFGTLLERALEASERSRLGAHFTPRVYVERLVVPTIIQPLREDWAEVRALVEDFTRRGLPEEARKAVRDFHHTLCTTRVLDPACGTGNFLYVAFELMKRLEGEVLEALEALGEDEARLLFEGETVSPRQFHGLDLNPRAVPIADLVLWIGFLKWQLRTVAPERLSQPILHAYGTICHQDAVLAYDREELLRDEQGAPITVWDGRSTKLHPITGEEVPDDSKRKELYHYENPRRAPWPEAEFIVGNPPFIAGKDLRIELGDGYAEAVWEVRPSVPGGADFVMHFWDEAATRLTALPPKGRANPLRRFGFITTNSITQTFSRRVVERHMNAKQPLSLVYAIPDHPWLKASDKAAVRIAMTVAEAGERPGVLAKVVKEDGLDTDTPQVRLESGEGRITSRLKLGADISKLAPLAAGKSIGHKGFMPYGTAFFISSEQAKTFGLGRIPDAEKFIRPYLNGWSLNNRWNGRHTLDFHERDEDFVRANFPSAYQHLLSSSKPVRAENKIEYRKKYWWRYGQPSVHMRDALAGLARFIATAETAKHRVFSFLESGIAPDQKVRVIATDSPAWLSILSSRLHVWFSFATGGWQGAGNDPVYQHTNTFDPFPFPILKNAQAEALATLGERLDAFRKERLDAHGFLTMTEMYNVLERLRELEAGADVLPLSQKERDIHEAGLISVLKELHDDIDRAAFAAYGWDDLGAKLVGKPGGTMPSPHKSDSQEEAEEELLKRLVTLNQARAAEERRGHVRWLRSEYQQPRLGHKVSGELDLVAEQARAAGGEELAWPADGLAQIRVVRDMLQQAESPLSAEAVAALFKGRNTPARRARVAEVLETLVVTGAAREGETGFFLPR